MNRELIDRLVGRVAQETRLARAARHPRARIAHHMLADAYRTLVSRLAMAEEDPRRRLSVLSMQRALVEQGAPASLAPPIGFLADVSG